MTIGEKLKLLQKYSGLTQEALARQLDVTFATFNRWINEKAKPRAKAEAKINELYKEYSGEKEIPKSVLRAKKNLIIQKSPEQKNLVQKILKNPDIRDEFYLSLTYNSNRIEGSTLSMDETADILFQNVALPNKSLVEQLEAKNHQTALEYLFRHLSERKPLNENFILKLHTILMNSIREDAGTYRFHGVRIMGANVPTANYLKVPSLMKKLVKDMNRKKVDVVEQIANIHARFEQIHPFGDGNGRIGRLLMHAMTLKKNLPPVVINQDKKRLYMKYLNKAQTNDDYSLLEDLICDAILEGYRILER
jgi:Fic family protein